MPATENFADVHVGDVKLNEEVMPMTPKPDQMTSRATHQMKSMAGSGAYRYRIKWPCAWKALAARSLFSA